MFLVEDPVSVFTLGIEGQAGPHKEVNVLTLSNHKRLYARGRKMLIMILSKLAYEAVRI